MLKMTNNSLISIDLGFRPFYTVNENGIDDVMQVKTLEKPMQWL